MGGHVLLARGSLEPRVSVPSVQGTEVMIVAQASTDPNRLDPMDAVLAPCLVLLLVDLERSFDATLICLHFGISQQEANPVRIGHKVSPSLRESRLLAPSDNSYSMLQSSAPAWQTSFFTAFFLAETRKRRHLS